MKRIIIAAACAMALVSCGNSGKKAAQTIDLNGEWTVTAVRNVDLATADSTPFLGFNLEEKQVYGNIGCNSLMGGVAVDASKGVIGFENTGTTQMMCADMSVEDALKQALAEVRSYEEISENTVALLDAAGEQIIVISKNLYFFLCGCLGITEIVSIFAIPNATSCFVRVS